MYLLALGTKTPSIRRSVWSKPKCKTYWDSAKRGLFGDGLWYENFRMTWTTFVTLCSIFDPHFLKQVTRLRMPVDVDEQIAVTLWRLASNIEYRTILQLFGLGISTVCTIVLKTCEVMAQHLLPEYVWIPNEDKLREVVQEFEHLWGFPQVAGAIDGTHIPVLKPNASPSDYYNRNKFYSILIQAVVNSCGRFLDVNIGWPGKVHDARVLVNFSFYQSQVSGRLFPDWKKYFGGVQVPLLVYWEIQYIPYFHG